MPAPGEAPGRTVVLAGASGLVGGALLEGLLADAAVAAVHTLGRRTLPLQHPRLTQHVVDFAALPELPSAGEVYLALGTTIKVAGSQEAFRAVDYEANLAVAQAMRSRGARRLGLVSAMGADPSSRVFYSRIKGELELALSKLGYETLVIARPSVLSGDRESLGQPPRRGEELAQVAGRWLGRLVPADYRPIEARRVAHALLQAVPATQGLRLVASGEMQARPA